jgi:hypothetical protein
MITNINEHFKETYLKFHHKDSDKLFKIDDILINKLIEDNTYINVSFNQKISEYLYVDNNLVDITISHPILDEDDNELYMSTHQYNVYSNDNIFTSIISQIILDDDVQIDSNEYSINYLYNNNLLASKHYSYDFQEYYKYDKHNNISKIDNDDSTTKYSYNASNKVSSKSIGKETTLYNYDKNDNLIHIKVSKKNKTLYEIFNTYHNNNLIKISSNGYNCEYTYNKQGLIDTIRESSPNHYDYINIEYDTANHIKYVNYNNGLEEFYTFNHDNILLKFSDNKHGTIFENDDAILTVDKSKTIVHYSHSIH